MIKRIFSMIFSLTIALSFCFSDCFSVSAQTTILPPTNINGYDNLNVVYIKWTKVKNVTGYILYRSTNGKSYKKIATNFRSSNIKYNDENVSKGIVYYYKVKSYKSINGKKTYSKYSSIYKVRNGFDFYVARTDTSVGLFWQQIKSATGYEVYYNINGGTYKKIKTISKNYNTSYTKTKLDCDKNKYGFFVKAYKTSKSKKVYLDTTSKKMSYSADALFNGECGKPKSYYRLIDVQSKTAKTLSKISLSKADKSTIQSFISKNEYEDMSPSDMVRMAFSYIHNEVQYVYGNNYSSISECSYVEAAFNRNAGQCVQYNGAMVAFLTYMGYEAKLLQGYRGSSTKNCWQHFWGEIVLNDRVYVMETGNESQDGSWNYFCKRYSETKKYIKCGKYVSGIKA